MLGTRGEFLHIFFAFFTGETWGEFYYTYLSSEPTTSFDDGTCLHASVMHKVHYEGDYVFDLHRSTRT